MSQFRNFAGERNRASEEALQARVAIERLCPHAREVAQCSTTQWKNDGVRFMAADADRHATKVSEPNQ